jgi:peptidyl-prolyl cis-trans isomerase D
MLQAIKERAQGWVAWAIVILISIPFALWGIQSYLGVGSEPTVAEVNGAEITERQLDRNVQRSRMQLRDRLGAAYNPDLFETGELRAQVLDRMIRDAVLLDASLAMGLRVSDQAVRAAILAEPAFQAGGVFDKGTYERVLRLQGLTPTAYEEQLRRGLLATQLARAVTDTGFATDTELAMATRLLRQQRDIAYVNLPKDAFLPEQEPSQEEIQAYYDANPQRFESPERVRLSYIVLDADALGGDADLDEATLRAAYDERIDEFQEPERRVVRHILLTVPAAADDAQAQAVKQRLADLKARIDAGEDFGAVARDASDDPVSAAQGGDLGEVARGMMDPAFEQAAFSLAEGVVSEPVRSRFGYHLIEVTAIEGGEPAPFEDVREQLARDLDSGGAETAYFELAEQLANLTYESPDSLIPAAETLELQVQTSDWIERGGGEGMLGNARVTAAAFSEDVLVRGNNSELIEPDPDRMRAIVLRVDEHEPAAVRPLEAVRDEIVAALREQEAAAAALAAAEDMAGRLRAGEALDALLESAPEAATLEEPGKVTRSQADVPRTVLELAFAAPRPGAGAVSYAVGQEPGGDAVVVAVRGVADGDGEGLDPALRDAERRLLARNQAEHGFERILDDLVRRAKIERREITREEP